jgi:hypothetical protein
LLKGMLYRETSRLNLKQDWVEHCTSLHILSFSRFKSLTG